MLSLKGELKLGNGRRDGADACLRRLTLALGERYTEVHTYGDAVSARARGFDIVGRGPRTHPMLPFEAAKLQMQTVENRSQLAYSLSRKMQLLFFLCVSTPVALVALFVPHASGGALGALLVISAVGVFNFVITTFRARRWLADLCGEV